MGESNFGESHPADMGLRYGLLSRDFNIVHISPLLTRLFGYPRTFAQGLCTANYILKVLSEDEGRKVRSPSLQHCRPVFLGQTVSLQVGASRVEVVDPAGSLLVQGTWS